MTPRPKFRARRSLSTLAFGRLPSRMSAASLTIRLKCEAGLSPLICHRGHERCPPFTDRRQRCHRSSRGLLIQVAQVAFDVLQVLVIGQAYLGIQSVEVNSPQLAAADELSDADNVIDERLEAIVVHPPVADGGNALIRRGAPNVPDRLRMPATLMLCVSTSPAKALMLRAHAGS